jgi:hypothetical protein
MPGLTERIANLSWLIKAVGAVIAILPGVAILLGLVDIPPDLEDLIKYVSFAISVVTILAVLLLTSAIQRLSSGWAVAIIAACVIGGAASAIAYRGYASTHILTVIGDTGEAEHLIIPQDPSPELRALVEPLSYDYAEALQTHVQRVRVKQLMVRESGPATLRMIVLLVVAQTLTIGAIVLGAWKLSGALGAGPRPPLDGGEGGAAG